MKVFHFRVPTLLALGTGFLLGSRAGRGPWESVAAKVAEVRSRQCGGAAEAYGGNGHGAEGVVSPVGETRPGDRLPFSSV